MRNDIKFLLVERPRIGSRKRSLKTGGSLKAGVDYGDDFDAGPSVLPSSIAANGWSQKELNENLRPLYQFLRKSVGKPWNKVYSEIREQIDPRRTIGFHVLQHVEQFVHQDVIVIKRVPYWQTGGKEFYGMYVDPRTGILRHHPYRKRPPEPKAVDSVRWRNDIWFKMEVLRKRTECGCVNFRDAKRPVCTHGNEPIPQEIWYVVEYRRRRPEEVYRVIRPGDPESARHHVTEESQAHTIYYRDVPEKLKDLVLVSKKVANTKELKALRDLLRQ
ncbi:MAG: hypothetical protein QOG67_2076 [Verrucomicrobiota bacterium]